MKKKLIITAVFASSLVLFSCSNNEKPEKVEKIIEEEMQIDEEGLEKEFEEEVNKIDSEEKTTTVTKTTIEEKIKDGKKIVEEKKVEIKVN